MYKYVEINDGFFPILAVLLNMPWLSRLLKTWPFSNALPKDGDEIGFGIDEVSHAQYLSAIPHVVRLAN